MKCRFHYHLKLYSTRDYHEILYIFEIHFCQSTVPINLNIFHRLFAIYSRDFKSSRLDVLFHILDQYSCEFGDNKYYALCGFGGILSCGITHTGIVPLDLIKCRIQVR